MQCLILSHREDDGNRLLCPSPRFCADYPTYENSVFGTIQWQHSHNFGSICNKSVCHSRLISMVWVARFASRNVASTDMHNLIDPLSSHTRFLFYPPFHLFIRHPEIMASRLLVILCLCTCFSTVTYTAAPPVNVALDQPLEPPENV